MTYGQLNPGQCAAAVLLLVIGVVLMLVAQRRDWRPSLALAVFTAVVLRLVMLGLTWRTLPYDLVYDFKAAGLDVLHHQDPILNNRQNGWGSLPVYAFVLAAAYWGTLHLHISWLILARLPALFCDLGVVVLVGVLAEAAGERAALRRFQYACSPLAILVSSVHGQAEPFCFLFALGAFALILRAGPRISGRRAGAAGILFGLAIAAQTWPVVFAPALLLALPAWRRRAQFTAGVAAILALLFVTLPLTVGTPVAKLPFIATQFFNTRPSFGNWGWSGVWLTVHPTALPVWQDPLWLNAGSIGTKLAIVGALLAVWWWRRGHPLDIATVTTTTLLVLTPSFGNQYLVWQAPSAIAKPARLSIPLQIVLGAYAAIFYLPLQMLTWQNWEIANDVMMFVSLPVIAFMILALPWRRRRQWQPPATPAPQDPGRLQRGDSLDPVTPAHGGDAHTAVPGVQASGGADGSSIMRDSAAAPLPYLDPTDP
jgi:Glycosyltransferase family 87